MGYTGTYQRQDQLIAAASGRSAAWSAFWKIYFFALLAIDLAAPFLMPEFYVDLSILLTVDTIMMLIGFIGLFGYSWQERIFTRSFWIGYCAAFLLYCIAVFFVPMTPGMMNAVTKNLPHILAVGIPIAILHLPMVAAMFLYPFKSKEIWGGEATAK